MSPERWLVFSQGTEELMTVFSLRRPRAQENVIRDKEIIRSMSHDSGKLLSKWLWRTASFYVHHSGKAACKTECLSSVLVKWGVAKCIIHYRSHIFPGGEKCEEENCSPPSVSSWCSLEAHCLGSHCLWLLTKSHQGQVSYHRVQSLGDAEDYSRNALC